MATEIKRIAREAAINYYAQSIKNKNNLEKIKIWEQQLLNFKKEYDNIKIQYDLLGKTYIHILNIEYAYQEVEDWVNIKNSVNIDIQQQNLLVEYQEIFLKGYYLINMIKDNIVQQFATQYQLGYSDYGLDNEQKIYIGTFSLQELYKNINISLSGNSLQGYLSAALKQQMVVDKYYNALKNVQIPNVPNNYHTLFGQIFSLFNQNNPLGVWAYNRGHRNKNNTYINYTNKGRAFQLYVQLVGMYHRNLAISNFDQIADLAIKIYKDSTESIKGGDWFLNQLKFFGITGGQGGVGLISDLELNRIIVQYLQIFKLIQSQDNIQNVTKKLQELLSKNLDLAISKSEEKLIKQIQKKIKDFVQDSYKINI